MQELKCSSPKGEELHGLHKLVTDCSVAHWQKAVNASGVTGQSGDAPREISKRKGIEAFLLLRNTNWGPADSRKGKEKGKKKKKEGNNRGYVENNLRKESDLNTEGVWNAWSQYTSQHWRAVRLQSWAKLSKLLIVYELQQRPFC